MTNGGFYLLIVLLEGDLKRVQSYLKFARLLSKATYEENVRRLVRDVQYLDDDATLPMYIEKVELAGGDSDRAYLRTEHLEAVKKVLVTLEDFQLLVTIYEDTEWSNEARKVFLVRRRC